MSNTYCLINSEGDIFVINFKNEKIIAKALLEGGKGKITFEVDKLLVNEFLNNKIKLKILLDNSSTKTVEYLDYETNSTSNVNKELVGELSCGDEYYFNIPEGMIMSYEKRIELAIRTNKLKLDFNEMMNRIRNYFYIKKKNELVYNIFGSKNPILIEYEKEWCKERQHFEDIDIPVLHICHNEGERLNTKKVCLKEDFNLDIKEISEKKIIDLTREEINYLSYYRVNFHIDLARNPNFWTEEAKKQIIQNWVDDYSPFRGYVSTDIF